MSTTPTTGARKPWDAAKEKRLLLSIIHEAGLKVDWEKIAARTALGVTGEACK
jgi:hypothetical protein